MFDLGDLTAPRGSPAYVKALHVKAMAALNDATATRERVECWVNGLLEDDSFRQLTDRDGRPFMFWADFCATPQPFGLGYSEAAIRELAKSRPSAKDLADHAEPLAKHGEVGNGRSRGVMHTSTSERGSGKAAYLAARIARDRPDVLARMRAGEFGSVRQAAKAAGIVRERWSLPAGSVAAMAAYLKGRLSIEERAALAEALRTSP